MERAVTTIATTTTRLRMPSHRREFIAVPPSPTRAHAAFTDLGVPESLCFGTSIQLALRNDVEFRL